MTEHEQFAEDIALYALNVLEGEDRAHLEKHLADCSTCRVELDHLRGDGALLALSAVGPRPPQRARQRLLDAVAQEAVPAVSQKTRTDGATEDGATRAVGTRRSWWGVLGWAATAAVLVFTASLWKQNAALRQDVSTLRSLFGQQTVKLEQARSVASTITNAEGERFTLVAVKSPPQPQGKAFYLRNRSNLVFVANNLPALPPQKAYELWLIPAQGAPIPAGVFKPDAHGSATVVNPPLPAGAEAKAFAITVESEAGATAPTMPIIMMGTGE